MRNVVFRFEDLDAFRRALAEGDQELFLPPGEMVQNGEWVLAIFEVGTRRRATAAAARGSDAGIGPFVVAFAQRDWQRLCEFADANSDRLRASKRRHLDRVPPAPVALRAVMPTSDARARVPLRALSVEGARILVIGDETMLRDAIAGVAKDGGLVVAGVATAEKALERLRREHFDLAVVSCNVGQTSGLDLCRTIRDENALCKLPLLFLSADGSPARVADAFASGADDYVTRPLRAPELAARILGLLCRARLAQTSQS